MGPLSLPTQRPKITVQSARPPRSKLSGSETGFICDLSDLSGATADTHRAGRKKLIVVVFIIKNLQFARYIFASLPGFPKKKITQAVFPFAPFAGAIQHMPFL